MSDTFTTTRRWGLFVATRNRRELLAGNIRLFHKNGPVVHTFLQTRSNHALERTWYFGLLTLGHVGPGESPIPQGWWTSWASIRVERNPRHMSIHFALADKFKQGSWRQTTSSHRYDLVKKKGRKFLTLLVGERD